MPNDQQFKSYLDKEYFYPNLQKDQKFLELLGFNGLVPYKYQQLSIIPLLTHNYLNLEK